MSDRKPRLWQPKPGVLTEGEPWTGILSDLPDEWLELDMITVDEATGFAIVRTLQGLGEARLGDVLARGTAIREFYPVLRPAWYAKYEPVDPS